MYRCSRPGCGWQSIAPSEAAAFEQYVDHLVGEHTTEVEADIPDGMVQVRFDGEWRTVTREEARRLHEEYFGEGASNAGGTTSNSVFPAVFRGYLDHRSGTASRNPALPRPGANKALYNYSERTCTVGRRHPQMAYEFSCAEAGKSDCAFEIRDENQDELTQFVQEHARNTHDMEMSESDVQDAMRTV